MIDDHSVEVPLSSHILVIRNDDRPGMIGIGILLGKAEVNISFMGLGRDGAEPCVNGIGVRSAKGEILET